MFATSNGYNFKNLNEYTLLYIMCKNREVFVKFTFLNVGIAARVSRLVVL
jgi:hypothetical protein